MTVTATRRASDAPGGIRNGLGFSTSEVLTDKGTGSQDAVPRAVTCAKCGAEIPPEQNMLVLAVRFGYSQSWCRRGNALCVSCANGLDWPFKDVIPWRTHGARVAGHSRGDYQHRCPRCGRPFYGAMQRRYCSDACGEETRNGRRDRTRDRTPRRCEVCEATFTPPRADGRYCKPACRQKAYRARMGGGA